MRVVGGILEGRHACDKRIIASLALHWLTAAHFDTHGVAGAMLNQPRQDIELCLLVQEGAGRLADLLTQIRAGNEDLGDDFGKSALWRLGCVTALRCIIPDVSR